ncbi:MAG: acyl-CoA dehydrogenase family protein [Rhodospirillales bacterium]|jgi:indole-3-acetate monooxygenase
MGPEASGAETAPQRPAPTTDTAEILARVARVVPAIKEASQQIEQDRRLPPELREKLYQEKLFRLLLPKDFGGEEIDPLTFFQVISAIAEADASTAWCLCQANGCSASAAYVEPHVAEAIWGSDPKAVVAWGPGKAEAIRKDDGYVVTGRWQFASGSRHSTWLGARMPITLPNGEEAFRVLFFPSGEAEMEDIWNVLGLRGTASDGYSIKDVFIQQDYMATRDVEAEERRYNAPLYLIHANIHYATGFSGVALGIARAMLEDFKELASKKTPSRLTQRLCENPVIQLAVAKAEARIRSARALMLSEWREIWDEVVSTHTFSEDARMRLRFSATYCIHEAKEVVDALYDASGATTIFSSNQMQKYFRDIHTLTQQGQGRSMYMQVAGAHLMGLKADMPEPS